MVWYSNLYVGPLVSKRKDKLIYDIDSGRYPVGVYLVTVPDSHMGQVEIIPARELKYEYARERVLMILGIALGKSEAVGLVKNLVSDVYADQGDVRIREWLSEEHTPRG